jgi:hypothetical protein
VALSATAAGALTGCGTTRAGDATAVTATGSPSGSTTTGALAQLRKAGDTTSGAKSARVHQVITEAGETRTGDGEISWDGGGQAVMRTQLPAAMKAKLESDGTADVIVTHTATYVNMHVGLPLQKDFGGTHWLEYDNTDLRKLNAGTAALVSLEANADPVAEVQALIASGKVADPRSETVNGVQTTHYSADLTPDDFKPTGSSADAALAAHRQLLIATGVKTDHVDVWVDSHNLVVRRDNRETSGTGAVVSGEADYTDYGVQFLPTPPPATDTLNAGKAMANAATKGQQPDLGTT